jgi:hypothetical protein
MEIQEQPRINQGQSIKPIWEIFLYSRPHVLNLETRNEVHLEPAEMKTLVYLLCSHVFSDDKGFVPAVDLKRELKQHTTLDTHIKKLRQKLGHSAITTQGRLYRKLELDWFKCDFLAWGNLIHPRMQTLRNDNDLDEKHLSVVRELKAEHFCPHFAEDCFKRWRNKLAEWQRQLPQKKTEYPHVNKNPTDRDLFFEVLSRKKSEIISPFIGFGWGDMLAFQRCPDEKGWPVNEVEVQLEKEAFSLLSTDAVAYQKFFNEKKDERGFHHDGTKFMLTRNPFAGTDCPSLSLVVQSTLYSHVQFFKEHVAEAEDKNRRNQLMRDFLEESLVATFPHSLCMHMVILTVDEKILVARRSRKLKGGNWAVGKSSISIEEQMAPSDFLNTDKTTLLPWTQRCLREEVSVEAGDYEDKDLRVLSIFLESNFLNVALCVHAKLSIDSETLVRRIKNDPKRDQEIDRVEFLDLKRSSIISELFRPSRDYHPSSRYRLLEVFLLHFGWPKYSEYSGYEST